MSRRYVPQYFVQSVEDDPRYARIEALVDGGRCEVVLLDKTTNRKIVYSTLSRKVDALKANGEDAYATRIDFEVFTLGDSIPLFRIRFHDRIGQVIEWGFVAGQMVPHASPEVISRTDDSGIAFFYAPRRAAAAVETSLTIGDREYRPEPTQSSARLGTFYATDMTIGQILPGTQLWSEGHSLRRAHAAPQSQLYCRRSADAYARHWCQHRDVCGRRRGSANRIRRGHLVKHGSA
jgi:hypothetical protein